MDETSPTVSLTATLTVKRDSAHSASQHPDSPSEIFVSQSLWRPRGARGVFGGQVVAQALLSACATTPPPLSLHSQHCYFLLAADAAIPITYTVERLRDGKSYVTRLVRASQNGSVVSVLLASFTLPPIALPPFKDGPRPPFGFIPTLSNQSKAPEVPGLSHSLRMAVEPNSSVATASKHGLQSQTPGVTFPNYAERFQIEVGDMLRWDECELEEKRWQRYLDDQGEELKGRARTSVEEYIQERKESFISIRVARSRRGRPARNERSMWLRARLAPGEKPDTETIKAMIACMTDFQFIGTASRSVGLSRASSPRLGMLASLDHTTHFYPIPANFDPATPLLHLMEAAVADVTSGRGLVRGLLYTPEGVLLAATLQEGVVRADQGKADKGLVEGEGAGDMDERGKRGAIKAKAKM